MMYTKLLIDIFKMAQKEGESRMSEEKEGGTVELLADEWISVDDGFPKTSPHSYECEMSGKVMVRGVGKLQYPWISHIHLDRAKKYKDYAWGVDKDEGRYTWLCPHMGIEEAQKITQWKYFN